MNDRKRIKNEAINWRSFENIYIYLFLCLCNNKVYGEIAEKE